MLLTTGMYGRGFGHIVTGEIFCKTWQRLRTGWGKKGQ